MRILTRISLQLSTAAADARTGMKPPELNIIRQASGKQQLSENPFLHFL
jgi:hypothetical protein